MYNKGSVNISGLFELAQGANDVVKDLIFALLFYIKSEYGTDEYGIEIQSYYQKGNDLGSFCSYYPDIIALTYQGSKIYKQIDSLKKRAMCAAFKIAKVVKPDPMDDDCDETYEEMVSEKIEIGNNLRLLEGYLGNFTSMSGLVWDIISRIYEYNDVKAIEKEVDNNIFTISELNDLNEHTKLLLTEDPDKVINYNGQQMIAKDIVTDDLNIEKRKEIRKNYWDGNYDDSWVLKVRSYQKRMIPFSSVLITEDLAARSWSTYSHECARPNISDEEAIIRAQETMKYLDVDEISVGDLISHPKFYIYIGHTFVEHVLLGVAYDGLK